MNVGYVNCKDLNNPINNKVCPICNKDIYINKYGSDFACIDINCALGHGARQLIKTINDMMDLLNNK